MNHEVTNVIQAASVILNSINGDTISAGNVEPVKQMSMQLMVPISYGQETSHGPAALIFPETIQLSMTGETIGAGKVSSVGLDALVVSAQDQDMIQLTNQDTFSIGYFSNTQSGGEPQYTECGVFSNGTVSLTKVPVLPIIKYQDNYYFIIEAWIDGTATQAPTGDVQGICPGEEISQTEPLFGGTPAGVAQIRPVGQFAHIRSVEGGHSIKFVPQVGGPTSIWLI